MPAYLRQLVVILVLALMAFTFARTLACPSTMPAQAFGRRRNLWFGVTVTAFLAHNFWIFLGVSAVLVLSAASKERNRLAMYFFVLFAVPPVSMMISGFGPIENLFSLDYPRLLVFTLLLPGYLTLRRQGDTVGFGRLPADKILAAYLILGFFLVFRVATFTGTLRQSVFGAFIDVFLPYYVASRSLKNPQQFRDALMAFVVAGLALGAIAIFESAKGWILFDGLGEALGVSAWSAGGYALRGGALRAVASVGDPIVLGYVLTVAMGCYMYVRRHVASATWQSAVLLVLVGGLLASLSRGPWVGAAGLFLTYALGGPMPLRNLLRVGLAIGCLVGILYALPFGAKFISALPFVGTVDQGSVVYRERLFDVATGAVMLHPFFGDPHILSLGVMQQLRQGQGIIDLVNTYIGVALSSGLVGLSLFVSFFAATGLQVVFTMKRLRSRDRDLYELGRALLATMIGVFIIIATVSSVLVIPVVYWALAGLGVAYTRLGAHAGALSKNAIPTVDHDAFLPEAGASGRIQNGYLPRGAP